MSQTERRPSAARPDAAAVAAGHAIYTLSSLRAYDLIVHGLSNRFAWRCPTALLQAYYRANLADGHLEAGVGTGFFIDRAKRASFRRLTLLDINPACLAVSARRLARYSPHTVQASLFDVLPDAPAYGSVGLTYVLHCLPGTMAEKAQAIDALRSVLDRDSVLFGATILGEGIAPNAAARRLLSLYNARGIFSNGRDSLDSLRQALARRFESVEIEQRGLVALFRATGLKPG